MIIVWQGTWKDVDLMTFEHVLRCQALLACGHIGLKGAGLGGVRDDDECRGDVRV